MPLEIRFAYVCRKKFEELSGTDERRRYCDSCRLEVINLDPLDERERLEVFERAAASPERVCVAATLPFARARSCATLPPPPRPTAGLPAIPPPEKLREERARLEQQTHAQSGDTALGRLLSKIRFW